MSQALSAVNIHAVFSTKGRAPFLADREIRHEMHKVLGGISRKLDCPTVIVGGVEDHVHLLAALSRTITQAEYIKEVKRASSLWIKPRVPEFAWQGGYGIFAVGQSQIPSVKEYIANQEVHHQTGTFQEEFRALLLAHNLEWDERYLWD